MPYASDLKQMQNPKFLIYGQAGSGKTTAFRTIPGRKFLYMLDPAGLNSVMPSDNIFYMDFQVSAIPMNVNTLKGSKDAASPSYESMDTYVQWENDFQNRLDKNWFADPDVEIDGVKGGFDAIGFDSLTTLAGLVMDRILQINMRAGKQPEIGDYGILANTISRIIRNAAATNCIVFLSAHEQVTQHKLSKRVSTEIMVPGQLKGFLPILFSDIYHAEATIDEKSGDPKYSLGTTPTDDFGLARCAEALRDVGMPLFLDATIKNKKDPESYGLGPYIKKLRGV